MLSPALFDFLEQLGAYNTKEWMDEHREWYHEIRAEFLGFVDDCIVSYEGIDPLFHGVPTKNVIFRINRDVRYSKNKSLYKHRMSMHLAPGGRKSELVGPYIHIQPGNQSFVGGGLWHPESRALRAFRDYVAVHYKKFDVVLSDKKFAGFFGSREIDTLKTSPRGFAKDHPALRYLQYKSFFFRRNFSDTEVLDPGFIDACKQAMQLQLGLNAYVNTAIELGRPVDDGEIFV